MRRSHLRSICVILSSCVLLSAGEARSYSIDTVAGRGVGDGKKAKKAGLFSPTGIAFLGNATLIADSEHGRIRLVRPNNKIRTFAGTFPGTFGDFAPAEAAGLKLPLKARVAANGDVLIAEFGSHRVRLISDATGLAMPVAGRPDDPGFSGDGGLATNARLNGPADAFRDAAGNIYIADSNNHRIRKVDPAGIITTIAGTGQPGFDGNGGPAVQAKLRQPVCVVPGPGGVLYICELGNHTIRQIAADGTISRIAGKGGVAGFKGEKKPAKKARLDSPTDVAVAPDGDLLIADSKNHRVRRINMQNKKRKIRTVAGNGVEGFTGNNVPALSPLGEPTGLGFHPDGRLLIAEASNHRVRALLGDTLTLFAGDGTTTFGGDGKKAKKATFSSIHGITVDNQGNLLIADNGANQRIRRVNAGNSRVTTIAGSGNSVFSGDGGPATQAGMTVSDLVVDGAGNIYFSDTSNHRVRRVSPTGTITTVAGTGSPGFSGDGGPATQAQLFMPTGLARDAAGNLYIADFNNSRIRRVDAGSQVITTVAGNGADGYNGDDRAATTASLNKPTDVTFDADGNMYIADFRNHRVRLVSGGQITTFAGNGTPGDSGDGPILPTAASLREPSDVKVDADGNVFIVDSGNHKIRRVAPGQGGMTTIAGTGLAGLRDAANATNGRMSLPLRIHLLSDGSMLVADNFNYVIRMLQP